jgi:hypothetical protein
MRMRRTTQIYAYYTPSEREVGRDLGGEHGMVDDRQREQGRGARRGARSGLVGDLIHELGPASPALETTWSSPVLVGRGGLGGLVFL